MKRVWIFVMMLAACTSGEYRPARGAFNDGVLALDASDWATAEQSFLRARSEAGVDPELRWRAAFDLGLTYAGHAASVAQGEQPDLEQALDLYGKSAGWFQDALRIQSTDAEARANLEIVLARQQAIADQLVAGEKALEAKLDKLIDAQRKVRDTARALLEQARGGAAANPTALEDQARALATTERVLLADAGVVSDLAGAEVATIEGKPEDQRTQEDQVRMAQLGVLHPWVQIARTALADTRRMLDEGKHETAHERADQAVDALKRAREALLDPVAVLRAIAQDQLEVGDQTGYLDHATAEANKLGGAPQQVPAWLTAMHLGGRQGEVRSRLDEVKAMLGQASAAAAQQPAPAADDPEAASQARMLARVKDALPSLETASAAMTKASDALTTSDLHAATAAQLEALIALSQAIEQFLELRGVIDLAWNEQNNIVAMLTGEGDAATLAPDERSKQVREGLTRNLGRIERVAGLLADEQGKLAAEAAQAAQQDPNADPQAAAQQQQAEQQRLAQAELLRGQALAALQELSAGKSKRAPLEPAKDAQARIDELRKLFFSIIEHLQELIRVQGETRDDSTDAAGLDDLGRAPLLPGLIQRQGDHRGVAQAIADALAAQADAPPPPQPQPGAPDAEKLGQAAEEVRAATGDMDDASGLLTKANDPSQPVSVDLQPALDSQQSAIDHLKAALALLQPPQQGQDQQQDPKPDDQQDQQPQDPKDQQQQEPVDRRREEVREQEAQRRKEREEKSRPQEDPVEKDW